MKLDKETEDKINNLPTVMKYIVAFLLKCIDDIINGKCDDKEIIKAMNTVKDNSEGRFSKEELMNYDEAGNALGFGTTNRVGLKRLLDNNNIHQVKIGSTKVGFLKSKIIELKNHYKR